MKKRILIIAMSFIVLVMTIAGATTAYFTDTDKATNVFTVGKVDIQLTETVADPIDGTVTESVVDGKKVYNYGKVYPGQTYTKQPVITNIGSEDAYVGAVITLKNVYPEGQTGTANVATVFEGNNATVSDFLDGIVSGDDYFVNYSINGSDVVVKIVYKKILSARDNDTAPYNSITLFENVKIPAEWDNVKMANLQHLNIVVEAYAVQTVGFNDAKTALNTAFTSVGFPTASNYTPVTNP